MTAAREGRTPSAFGWHPYFDTKPALPAFFSKARAFATLAEMRHGSGQAAVTREELTNESSACVPCLDQSAPGPLQLVSGLERGYFRRVIARYNLRQTLLALVSLCLGLCAFAFAWWFFSFASAQLIRAFGGNITPVQLALIAWICCALIAVTGWHRWRNGGGYHHFHESGMMPTGEPQSGVAWEVQRTANRVGAWSYLLGQIFLAGPLQILSAFDRLRMRIPDAPTLEAELLTFRDQLREKNQWLPISDFSGRGQHVAYLARLGLVDFSPRKGTLKAR